MNNTLFEQMILSPLAQQLRLGKGDAFLIAGKRYTYAQLSDRISAIRQVLGHIQSDDKIIALAVHDDLETYASILALWMEGKAYVPLHPNQPLDRNLNIVAQIGTHFILDSNSDSAFKTSGREILCTQGLSSTGLLVDSWQKCSDQDLAYILFTSGSTGAPKGVCISRRNIATFLDSFWKTGISLTDTDRCLQAFDLTFDVSIQSFLVALTRGACVCTIPYGQVKYLYAASLMMNEGITFGAMAPSMLTYLRPYFDEMEVSSLKNCILTAEACPVDLLENWYKCAKNTEIYDFYGPTEATVYCTYYHLQRGAENLSENGIVSIGKPLANVKTIIIDESNNVLEGEEKGELCVSGDQVTPGYWKNDEKNARSFFTKEIDGQDVRFYHTGDLCRCDKSGNIIYLGRLDQQAKIQGFRVELGEIEYHVREYFHKEKRAVAIAFTNDNGLTEIGLVIESSAIETNSLVDYLEGKMPHYMVPTKIVFEDSFPLNHSDKIDRVALKQRLK